MHASLNIQYHIIRSYKSKYQQDQSNSPNNILPQLPQKKILADLGKQSWQSRRTDLAKPDQITANQSPLPPYKKFINWVFFIYKKMLNRQSSSNGKCLIK